MNNLELYGRLLDKKGKKRSRIKPWGTNTYVGQDKHYPLRLLFRYSLSESYLKILRSC